VLWFIGPAVAELLSLGGTTRIVITSPFILACSGPGAMTTIHQSITISQFCAAMSGVIVLALAFDHWRRHRWSFRLGFAAALMAVHPAWTVSAWHGDCGYFKRHTSYFLLAVLFGLLAYQVYVARRAA
jgi:hypothetical protein